MTRSDLTAPHGPTSSSNRSRQTMSTPDLDRYATDVVLKDGLTVHIRPVRPEDNDRMVEMWQRLSPETIRLRFFAPRTMDAEQMRFFSNVDYKDRFALVAETAGR